MMNPNSKRRIDRNNWRTPSWLWDKLQATFNFEIDGASDGTDNLLPDYHTSFTLPGKNRTIELMIGCGDIVNRIARYYINYSTKRIFINPPFNKIKFFLETFICRRNPHNFIHPSENVLFTCLLIPFTPNTQMWKKYIWPWASVFIFNHYVRCVDEEQKVIEHSPPLCLVLYTRLHDEVNKNWLKGYGVWVRRIT